MTKIGVLALQGAFAEHKAALEQLNADVVLVRRSQDLEGADGLVIPGGETTTISRLMAEVGLYDAIEKRSRNGLAVFGTCAGLILLGREKPPESVQTLGLMGVEMQRNTYGRQVDSFESDIAIPALGPAPFRAIFIRAPTIESVGPGVEVLARLPGGGVVVARQARLLGCTFHPELTGDLRLHRYFLDMIVNQD